MTDSTTPTTAPHSMSIHNALPNIIGGNEQQRALAIEAFNSLPDDVRALIAHSNVKFTIDTKEAETDFESGKNIVLGKNCFTSGHEVRYLAAHMLGFGLINSTELALEKELISNALTEHAARMMSSTVKDRDLLEKIIQPTRLSIAARGDNYMLATILAGYYIDALSPYDSGREYADLLKNRKQLYDTCLSIAHDNAAGLPIPPKVDIDVSKAPGTRQTPQLPAKPASPIRYEPASDVPDPEKRFFAALDKVRKLTHEGRGEFEYNIRSRLHLLLFNTPIISSKKVVEQVNQDYGLSHSVNITHRMVPGSHLSKILEAMPISVQTNGPAPADGVRGQHFDMEDMAAALIAGANGHFDRLLHLRLSPSGGLYNAAVAQGVDECQRRLGTRAQYEFYDPEKLLLESYLNGTHSLRELSGQPTTYDWLNYRINLPSEREYLITAIEEAATLTASYKKLKPAEMAELRKGLAELRQAFNEAVLTPEERAAQEDARRLAEAQAAAEEQRRREAHKLEETRRQEEALLTHSPYGMTPKLQGIQTRATRKGPPPPERDLADAWNQLAPLPNLLNRNFAPHRQLGDALFQTDEAHTLRVLDHICTSAALPDMNAAIRTATRDILINVLSESAETLAPQLQTPGVRERLVEANRERHEQVQRALQQAPLLIIAALGTPELIEEARGVQQLLFPERKKDAPGPDDAAYYRQELQQIAGRALQHAFGATGRPIPDSLAILAGIAAGAATVTTTITPSEQPVTPGEPPRQEDAPPAPVVAAPVPPPPPPPVPPTTTGSDVPDWDEIRQRVEGFITRNLQPASGDPYTMFRCRLGMEPGHPLTLELSRWVNAGHTRRAETRREVIAINRTDLDEALDIKKRVQAHVLNTPPIVPHRRLHNGHYTITEHDPFPDVMPINDPNRPEADGQPGRVDQRSGLWSLRLLFPDAPATQGGEPTLTEGYIPLGVEQSGSRDMANVRRRMVIDHLQQLRNQNQQFIEAGEQDRVRRVTGQDVRIWLEQQVRTLHRLSEEAQTAPANDSALDQRITTLATAWQQPVPNGVAPRDWLTQQVQQVGNRWEQARTIELDNYQFDRELTVNMPPPNADQAHRTTLIVHDPVFSGTPTPFWSAQIAILRDGQEITSGGKRLNLHISAAGPDGEPGSDPELVVDRLRVASRFLRDALTAYSQAYPTADWHTTGTPPQLGQYTPSQLRNTPNIDWTRLDTLVATLPYTGLMTVDSLIPEGGLTPDKENKVRFTLTFYREDGSQFRERRAGQHHSVPVTREFTMRACVTPDDTRRAIRDFAQCVQHSFTDSLEEAYSPYRDPDYEPQAQAAAPAIPPTPGQALERVVALVRHGPTMREQPPAETLNGAHDAPLLKPLDQYNPRAVVKMFDAAIRSASGSPHAQQAGIQQLPGQPAQGHGANGGDNGDNGDWQPGDPMHHHPPTDDQLEAVRGFRRYAQRGDTGFDRRI